MAFYFAAFGEGFQQLAEFIACIAQFGEAILLAFHGGQSSFGNLVSQGRDVAGNRQEYRAAGSGLDRHRQRHRLAGQQSGQFGALDFNTA